ncbi:MAG: DUF2934 domain-containing protein [Phycisphaerales bacterium]|nr:DUF2934 domain-containing protein [Phycisphaerales bacterium]
MALRKKNTPAPVTKITPPAAATPIGRSEAKGSGTLVAPAKTTTAPKAAVNPTHEQIAARAYQIYLARGFGPGSAESDWTQAERLLRAGL